MKRKKKLQKKEREAVGERRGKEERGWGKERERERYCIHALIDNNVLELRFLPRNLTIFYLRTGIGI